IPYQERWVDLAAMNTGGPFISQGSGSPVYGGWHAYDPRTERFGMLGGPFNWDEPVETNVTNHIFRTLPYGSSSTYGPGRTATVNAPVTTFGWTYTAPFAATYISENKSTSAHRYADPDGVVRRAAGAYANP